MLVGGRLLLSSGGLLCKGKSRTRLDKIYFNFLKRGFGLNRGRMVWVTESDFKVDATYKVKVSCNLTYWSHLNVSVCFQMGTNVLPFQLQAADAETHLDHRCALDINSRASFVRLSGIICTIGKSKCDLHVTFYYKMRVSCGAKINFNLT